MNNILSIFCVLNDIYGFRERKKNKMLKSFDLKAITSLNHFSRVFFYVAAAVATVVRMYQMGYSCEYACYLNDEPHHVINMIAFKI